MLWFLKHKLKSKRAKTRIEAIEKLALLEEHDVWQALENVMNDRETAVRIAAIKAIGPSANEIAKAMLVRGLSDSSPEIRRLSISKLGIQSDGNVVSTIVPLLSDPSHEVCWQAVKTLESRGWKPANERETLCLWIACGEFTRAASLGGLAVMPLLAALPQQSASNRKTIVDVLSKIESDVVTQALVRTLTDPDSRVRLAAVTGLANNTRPGVIEALEFALQDQAYFVREAAARILGDRHAVISFERLLPLVKEPHLEVRLAAVEALGKLADSRAIDSLTKCLDDDSGEVREAAIKALAVFKESRCLERLVLCLLDPHISVRQAAAGALSLITPDWEQTREARNTIPELQKALKSSDYWIRQSAADTLARIARYLDPPKSRTAYTHPDYVREKQAVRILTLAVGDADRDLRLAATEALGRIADADCLEPLIQSMHDPDAWVRQSATRSLNTVISSQAGHSSPSSATDSAQTIAG